jgi:hypothetical protein
MKKTTLFGLTTIFISIVACGQTTNKTSVTNNQVGLTTLNENGYSIQYPDSWDLNKSGQMGTSFILFSKPSSPQDQFKENVNLIVQDLSGQNLDLAKYVEISEGQIKTMITNGSLLDSKKLNSNGIEFQRVIFTGKQGIYDLKFEQYYWVEKQKAFILTLTCEIKEFDKYKETGEKILNSFKLN